MRKFSGKCFVYHARESDSVIRTQIALGGEAGFDTSRNKVSCRRDEPNNYMAKRETNQWTATRGGDDPACRHTSTSDQMLKTSRGDTTRRRRDNENYDR
jgi:hypothetical protein